MPVVGKLLVCPGGLRRWAYDMTSSRHFRTFLIAALVCSNICVFVLAVYSLQHSRAQYEERARTVTQNIANALDQSISGSIERIDLALHTVAGELERQLAAGGIDDKAMDAFLSRYARRLPEIVTFRASDANGLLIVGKGADRNIRLRGCEFFAGVGSLVRHDW